MSASSDSCYSPVRWMVKWSAIAMVFKVMKSTIDFNWAMGWPALTSCPTPPIAMTIWQRYPLTDQTTAIPLMVSLRFSMFWLSYGSTSRSSHSFAVVIDGVYTEREARIHNTVHDLNKVILFRKYPSSHIIYFTGGEEVIIAEITFIAVNRNSDIH